MPPLPRQLTASETAEYYGNSKAARSFALLTICLGTTLGPIALATVNLALPTIALDLNADAVIVSWMPIGFLLSSVMVMLPMGKLADIYGRKFFYFWGVLITGLLSIAASFGQNMEWLLFCRVLQGISMSMIFGSGMAILTSIYPAKDRGAALGIYSASVYLALTVSPVIGGWITELLGWRAVFWAQAPLSLVVLILMRLAIKGEWKNPERTPFDWTGSAIFACWAGTLVFGLTGLPKTSSIITLAISFPYLWLFLYHQNRVEHPLIRPSMFRQNRIFSFSLAAGTLMYSASYPIGFLLSLFIQLAMGLPPGETGTVLLIQPLVMAITAPLAGRISDRIEARYISTAGCCLMACGYFLISRVEPGQGAGALFVGQIMMGFGFGLFSTPNNNAAMSSISKSDLGIASASVNLARTMGNMLGMSLVGLLIYNMIGAAEFTADQTDELTRTVHIWMYIAIGFAAASALFSCSRGRMREREST